MANTRDIKNRIKSISNTQKITSTMEMVSTAKMKKLQTRLQQSKPYGDKINEIMTNLTTAGISFDDNPLFRVADKVRKILVLQITGNRGLCGSFNTNVIDTTLNFKQQKEEEGVSVDLYVVGKKSINFFRFIQQEMFRSMNNPDDKLTFEDATVISDELKEFFLTGEYDEIYVSYTRVESSVSQRPAIKKLLPIVTEGDAEEHYESTMDYIFEPDPERIFSYLLPLYLKMSVFSAFLESSFSENFARRVAMKNATDASSDMLKELKLTYNRARQAKITTEIAEIVGGAAALE